MDLMPMAQSCRLNFRVCAHDRNRYKVLSTDFPCPLAKTSTTQTTYNWNVTTLVSNGTQYNYHFELENGNDGGCTGCRDNSANFKVSSAGDSPSCSSTTSSAASTTGTAAPSSGTASATTTATVSSTFGSSQQSAAASTGSATSTHSNDHHSYIALGVGLGVGIPLAGIAGGIGWWLWRRSRKTHSVIHNDLADTGLPPYKDMVTGQSPLRKVRSAHSMQEMPSDNVVRQEMPGDHTAHELSGSGAWELDAMSKPSK